ncbi:hypothetical protein S40288_05060 [Stachybotrys chartarum IBT 40288]|nr:hypothetical protein S40288_05060 [Stachybotrys chartarum IBT 40288]
MADTEQPEVSTEPQARHVVYCGGTLIGPEPNPFPMLATTIFGWYKSLTSANPMPRDSLYSTSRGSHCPLYCEYGGTVKKCQEWLEKKHPELYSRIWSAGPSTLLPSPVPKPTWFLAFMRPRPLTFDPATEALEAATASLSVEAQKRAAKDAQKKTAKAEAAEQKHADKIATSVVTIKRIERNKKKFVTAIIGLEAFDLELKKVPIATARLPHDVSKDLAKKFATGCAVTKVPSGGEEIVLQGDVSDEVEEFILEKYKQVPEDNIELVDDKKKKKAAAA